MASREPRRQLSSMPFQSSSGEYRLNKELAKRPGPKGRETMKFKLHAPAMWIFVVALIIAVVAVVGVFTPIPYISLYGFWIAILAYVVLALGNVLDI